MAQIIQGKVLTAVPIIDVSDANNIYIGDAKIGSSEDAAVWQILKINKSGSIYHFYYADGDLRYNNVWSNRGSLNYS